MAVLHWMPVCDQTQEDGTFSISTRPQAELKYGNVPSSSVVSHTGVQCNTANHVLYLSHARLFNGFIYFGAFIHVSESLSSKLFQKNVEDKSDVINNRAGIFVAK